jgi:hypothetical protein
MKQFLLAAAGAGFGAVLGSLSVVWMNRVQASTVEKLEIRQIVLLNENGRQAAQLESRNNRTALTFFAGDGTPALEVGVNSREQARFIHFFGKRGRLVAALNSLAPYGETTLVLGDERQETRIIVGAFQTDIDASHGKGVDDWGIEFRSLGSIRPLYTALMKSPAYPAPPIVALRLVRSDGEEWTIH